MVHQKILKRVKRRTRKIVRSVSKTAKKIRKFISASTIWRKLTAAVKREILAVVKTEPKDIALDFICSVLEAETGLPEDVCEIIGEQLYKLVK